jgi:hypothetical protein
MRELYRHHGFDVQVVNVEVLDLPHLHIIDEHDTDTIREIRRNRNGLGDREIAVYIIQRIVPPTTGGLHQLGSNGVLIPVDGSTFELWDVAHEVCHALGLGHDGGPERLMYGGSRISGRDPNPTDFDTALIEEELRRMERSDFIYEC